MRTRNPLLAGYTALLFALILAAAPARAQLAVVVTNNVVDEDDPTCFMHGTLSAQAVDVTNQGAAPVVATLHCSVPSGALRVSATSIAQTIQPGAIVRLECSLFDFQDPPVDGSTVDFEVDVNGQVSTHSATVRCRQAPAPIERCAAARLGASSAACRAKLAAYADHAVTGDAAALTAALARTSEKLGKRLARSRTKLRRAARSPGRVRARSRCWRRAAWRSQRSPPTSKPTARKAPSTRSRGSAVPT